VEIYCSIGHCKVESHVTVIALFYLQGKSRSALLVIIMWGDLIG